MSAISDLNNLKAQGQGHFTSPQYRVCYIRRINGSNSEAGRTSRNQNDNDNKYQLLY